MKYAACLAALTVAVGSALAAGSAFAAPETEQFSSNPSARCQPAIRASEAQVNKRPLAMVNEGATTAFINCAFELEISQSDGYAVVLYVSNGSAAPANVTCTGISGWEGRAANEYLPQTVTIAAGDQGEFAWQDTDFAVGAAGLISVACRLPQGAAINDSYAVVFADDAV